MQHQRISELVQALRSILPPQATRGFSICGRDCFELLVEEPFEQFARSVLESVNYKLTDQVEAMDFRTAGGAKVREEDHQKKCASGALKRWMRCSEGCRHPNAQQWYKDCIAEARSKYQLSTVNPDNHQ